MIKTILHPLFLLPAFLLMCAVGTSVYIELRIDDFQDSLADMVGDPSVAMGLQFDESLWNLEKDLKENAPFEQIREDATAVRFKWEALLDNYSKPHLIEHKGVDTPEINAINYAVMQISDTLFENEPPDHTKITEILAQLSKIKKSVHGINHIVLKSYERDTALMLQDFEKQEMFREGLAAITLLTFILLLGIALRSIHLYKKENLSVNKAKKRNELLATALASLRIGVMIRDVVDPNMPIIFINSAFQDLTGFTFDDLRGKPIAFLAGMHTDKGALDKLLEAFKERRTMTTEILIYRKDNAPFWSEWHIGPVRDEKTGAVTHYFSLITDITIMKNAKESLLLAKEEAERAVSVKSAFLATMSHEIRTPINGILGVLNLMTDTALDKEQRGYIDLAVSSGNHLLQIVNDVLDYSKIEAGKFEIEASVFSLRALVKSTIALMEPAATAKKLSLSVLISETAPDYFISDEGRLKQILLNLVANAIKFTEEGSVEIRIHDLIDRSKNTQDSILLRIEVIDTGIGIGLEDQEKLFNEFTQVERSFSRRFGGTGLGLAITKQLVRLLGGEIGVESRQGHGSKFWLMLPLKCADQNVPVAVSSQQTSSPLPIAINQRHTILHADAAISDDGKPTILLAEDNAVNQLVATRYLQKAGLRVDLAENGRIAYEKAREKNYAAILMDISMPEMDGLAATRAIRALGHTHKDVPIIAVTAHVMRGDREQCIAAGMNDYLCKPIHYDSLCKVLSHWLGDKMPETLEKPNQGVCEEAPLFSAKILDHLRQDLDQEMVMNITGIYIKDSRVRTERLVQKIGNATPREIAKEAHALKSSSAGCGLMRYAELMKQLEIAGNKDDEATILSNREQILPLYEESVRLLIENREKTDNIES